MLIKPIISEKTMKDAALKRYTFEVGLFDNKPTIASEVASHFKVKVLAVATHIRPGKVKKAGKKRVIITRPDRKIAIVTIDKNQKIDLFETKVEEPVEKSKVAETAKKPEMQKNQTTKRVAAKKPTLIRTAKEK
jgi:large subunit ribosomal protein L23